MENASTIGDLRCKEVINVCDGSRLGFVNDVKINLCNGKVVAIVVPGKGKWFGLIGKGEDCVIPWECIRNIGDDIILVEVSPHAFVKGKRAWSSDKL